MENELIDIPDQLYNTDIKINPDFYIHSAIIKSQQCLIDENPRQGFMKFQIFVRYIEGLCRASKKLPPEYEQSIKDFKNKPEILEETDLFKKETLIAIFKNEALMTEVFQTRTITQELRI